MIEKQELESDTKKIYMENVKLVDNELAAEDFIRLRISAGFLETPLEQAKKAIKNGLFTVTAICEDKVIGMGRLVGDGAMYWYLQEIIVLPEYQGNGIGKAIVERLLKHVEESGFPETKVTVGLMAAKGKEAFYEKLGFFSRPNSNCGSGMAKYIEIKGL